MKSSRKKRRAPNPPGFKNTSLELTEKSPVQWEQDPLEERTSKNQDGTTNIKKESKIKTPQLLTFEVIAHLRQIGKSLNYYKVYATQFPFPKQSDAYEMTKSQIVNLRVQIDDLVSSKSTHEVKYILQILESKSEINQSIVDILKILEEIEEEMNQIHGSKTELPEGKLRQFNECRKKLSELSNMHCRIVTTKKHLLNNLHNFENQVYSSQYSGTIQKVKEIVNKYELAILEIDDLYQEPKRQLEKLLQDMDEDANNNILTENINIVLAEVEQVFKDNKIKIKHDKILERINSALNKDTYLLEPSKETLQKLKPSVNRSEILEKILDIQETIRIEEINMKAKSYITRLRELLAQTGDLVIDEINAILVWKECTNCCNQDLNQQLQNVLDHFKLDGSILATDTFENNIDLKSYFTNVETISIKPSENNVISRIRCEAEKLEQSVKYYLGTELSLDYYILSENLLRLLELLDKLDPGCDESLALSAINYVKSLIKSLSQNAYNNCLNSQQ